METQTKTIELLRNLGSYFLNNGEIIEHNGVKKPDVKLGFYMDIRDLLYEIESETKKNDKQSTLTISK